MSDRVRFIAELDTTQVEEALRRIHGMAGGSATGTSAGGGAGPSSDGRTGAQDSAPTSSRPAMERHRQMGSGGNGGVDLVSLAAVVLSLKEALREFGNAAIQFSDATMRTAMRKTGMFEGAPDFGIYGINHIRAASAASDATIGQLGVAGARASEDQIRKLYAANQRIEMMRAQGREAVQAVTDPEIMKASGTGASIVTTIAVARRLLHR